MNLNQETFICDENCFQIIAEFKKNIALKEYNDSRRTSEIVKAQDRIRPLINKHVFPKLRTENGKPPKRSKPNYYAVFIIMLLNDKLTKEGIIDTFKKLNKLVEESGNNGLYYNSDGLIMQDVKLTSEIEGNGWNCCCGKNHMCANTTMFEYNNFLLTVGDRCVSKEGINFNQNKRNAEKDKRKAEKARRKAEQARREARRAAKYRAKRKAEEALASPISCSKKYPDDSLQTLLQKDYNYVIWLYNNNFMNPRKYDNWKIKSIKAAQIQIIEKQISCIDSSDSDSSSDSSSDSDSDSD